MAENQAFVQSLGVKSSDLGVVEYIKVQRYDWKPMSWPEIWRAFSEAYPGQWAVQIFPPAEALVDDANIYHLYVLPEMPRGLSIHWVHR